MESLGISNEDDHPFSDAPEDFPFHDCPSEDQTDHSTSSRPELSSANLQSRSLRRRRISRSESKYPNSDTSSISSHITQTDEPQTTSRDRRDEPYLDSKENIKDVETTASGCDSVDPVRVASSLSKEKKEESTLTTEGYSRGGDWVDLDGDLGDPSSTNFLVFVAGLVIKAIGCQFNFLVTIIMFPLWALYFCCMFAIDPFRAIRRGRGYLITKLIDLWNLTFGSWSPFVCEWLKERRSVLQLALRFGCGLFWAIYVCIILCALLVSSLVVSGFIMNHLVEERIMIKENLNFDYTKMSPVAYVRIMSCFDTDSMMNSLENIEKGRLGSRVIQPDHKLQVIVSLTLPESEYNRNLGMFQVRVDFISAEGRTFASSRHPCMLKFKSEPIRLLTTFLKVAPLITGYISESQTVDVRISGYTEGDIPTACLKVIIEQRAEFLSGAGIPEIYDASLILETEHPFFKRIFWSWKKTIFIWMSMSLFIVELLLALVCCRPLIVPRSKSGDVSSSQN